MNTINEITSTPMVFNYQMEDYEKFVAQLASQIKAETVQHQVEYPEEFADGYTKAKILERGLSYRLANYTLNTDIECTRMPAKQFHLILYFYEYTSEHTLYCKIGNTVIENNDKYYRVALMTNSLTHQHIKFKKGTTAKGLSIQLTEEWLKNNISNLTEEKLATIRQKECLIDFISAKQRKILSDIFNSASNSNLPELFVKSRVLRLTEHFLNNICKRGLSEMPEFTSQKDFHALIKIEHQLLQSSSPDFPSIEALAKAVYMSESKLKKLFKQAYGMAIYQYYQKNRMHKAKELLVSKKYTITQVGTMMGYHNMSNFSVAFKKEFNFLPSEHEQLV
jgi:AraC-like DNA-binding protein